MISIVPTVSRENLLVTGESVADYLLVRLLPAAGEEAPSLPLNVALVIDNSGSMYGSDNRISHAIEAACHVVDMLAPDDMVSVVAFHDRAKTFQSCTPARKKEAIKQAVRSITSWESGGTELATGMRQACDEVRANLSRERLNRVLVLTDGNTANAESCLRIAKEEAGNGIAFSTGGVGDDWNEDLLKTIAAQGNGRWYYIETAADIPNAFQEELSRLQQTFLNNIALTAALKRGVTVKRVRQVEPEIADLLTQEVSEQEVVVRIGALEKDRPVCVLFQLSLAARQPGQYRIVDLFATYDVPGQPGQVARTDPVPVTVTFTTDPAQLYQDSEVLRYVDMEQVDVMVKRGTVLAAQGQKDKATQLLSVAAQISDRTGDGKKTRLIQDALQQLGAGGRIDRKTQLAMADRARRTKLMPEDEEA